MTTTYRATLTATDGTTETLTLASFDEWDALVEKYDVRDSDKPAGLLERQANDGAWKHAGEWDHRPKTRAVVEMTDAERTADRVRREREANEAHGAILRKQDNRENRRSYYLRTGR